MIKRYMLVLISAFPLISCSPNLDENITEDSDIKSLWVISKHNGTLDPFTKKTSDSFCTLEHPDFSFAYVVPSQKVIELHLSDSRKIMNGLSDDIRRVRSYVQRTHDYVTYGAHTLITNISGEGKVFAQPNDFGIEVTENYPPQINTDESQETPLETYCALFVVDDKYIESGCEELTLKLSIEKIKEIEEEMSTLSENYIVRTSLYRPLFDGRNRFSGEYESFVNADTVVNLQGIAVAIDSLLQCQIAIKME